MTHESYWVTIASITPVITAAAVIAVERNINEFVAVIGRMPRALRLVGLVLWLFWIGVIFGLIAAELISLSALRTGKAPGSVVSAIVSTSLSCGIALSVVAGAASSAIAGFAVTTSVHAMEAAMDIRIRMSGRKLKRRIRSMEKKIDTLESLNRELGAVVAVAVDIPEEDQALADKIAGEILEQKRYFTDLITTYRTFYSRNEQIRARLQQVVRKRLNEVPDVMQFAGRTLDGGDRKPPANMLARSRTRSSGDVSHGHAARAVARRIKRLQRPTASEES